MLEGPSIIGTVHATARDKSVLFNGDSHSATLIGYEDDLLVGKIASGDPCKAAAAAMVALPKQAEKKRVTITECV